MECWVCSRCGEGIYGSLEVVLLLASEHKCRPRFDRSTVTTCLMCLGSPSGLCAYHASQLVSLGLPNENRLLSR
jgi:hypothetical protein